MRLKHSSLLLDCLQLPTLKPLNIAPSTDVGLLPLRGSRDYPLEGLQ